MSELRKNKLHRIRIKYMLAIFALAFLVIVEYKGSETLMRYYSEASANVVGYAKETRSDSYTVTFNSNGGTGSMEGMTIKFGDSVNLRQNTFTKTDNNFIGWNTEEDGTGTNYYDEELVTNITTESVLNIILYAQWVDASMVAEVNGVTYNSIYTAISNVPNNTQTTIRLLKDISVSNKITVNANKNIILNLQGHTISNVSGANIPIIENSGTVTLINGTIRSSAGQGAVNNQAGGNFTISSGQIIAAGTRQAIYNAGGILEVKGTAYLESSAADRATIQNFKPTNQNAGTITISGGTIVSKSTTTKGAVQNEETGIVIVTGGTIISENNMGIDNVATLIIGTEDGNIDLTTPTIKGANYGVKTANSGTVEFYNGTVKGQIHAFNDESYITDLELGCNIGHSTETINGDTYEIAFLEIVGVPITFNANGGTPAETIVYITCNTTIGADMPQNPTRTHYTFDGWYTDPTNGTQITSATVVTVADTYYAHWTQTEAEVTFNANGGTMDGTNEEDTIIVNLGSSIGSANLPTPTRRYKSFVGWYTDPNPSLGTQIDGTESITQDITYYAHWTAQMVTVNFDPTSGTIPQADASKSVEAGEPVGELPTTATSANQYFTGWYTDPTNGTRIYENEMIGDTTVTFYAHWISNAVARIGAIHYATLQEAINDVPADNTQTTITLITNDLEAVCILDINKNIILDLNGYTLYNNGTKKTIGMDNGDLRTSVIENLGTLKITNGTVNTSNSNQAAINTGTGRVIIEDATITNTGTTSSTKKQAIYLYSGSLLVTGNTTVRANNTGAYGGYDRGAIQNAGGTVTITGGTVISTAGTAVVNQANATLILGEEDGTVGNTTPVIQGKTYGVKTSGTGSIFNFYDGIIKGVTGAIEGNISDVETDYKKEESTETIDNTTYYTAYLVPIEE